MIAPNFGEDPRVWRALGSSALLRAADRLITGLWRSAESSRTGMLLARIGQHWTSLPVADRTVVIGVTLLVASAVHVGLILLGEVPPGWLWLMPAGVASTIGLTLLFWPIAAGKA